MSNFFRTAAGRHDIDVGHSFEYSRQRYNAVCNEISDQMRDDALFGRPAGRHRPARVAVRLSALAAQEIRAES